MSAEQRKVFKLCKYCLTCLVFILWENAILVENVIWKSRPNAEDQGDKDTRRSKKKVEKGRKGPNNIAGHPHKLLLWLNGAQLHVYRFSVTKGIYLQQIFVKLNISTFIKTKSLKINITDYRQIFDPIELNLTITEILYQKEGVLKDQDSVYG